MRMKYCVSLHLPHAKCKLFTGLLERGVGAQLN